MNEHYLTIESALFWVAVAVVSVSGAARITRLVTYDIFPPMVAIRDWYAGKVNEAGEREGGFAKGLWTFLVLCGYCFGFWAYGLVLFTGYFSDWHPLWWLGTAWFGGGYWAAILMANDGEDD